MCEDRKACVEAAAEAAAQATRQLLLNEWQTTMQPLDEYVRHADRGALDYSVENLKNASLLNGGAAIALPAYVGFLEITDSGWVVGAAVAFLFGLFAAWLANASGYFTMVYQTRRAIAKREAAEDYLVDRFAQATGSDTASMARDSDAGDHDLRISERWRIAGIVLSFFSLGGFIAGVVFAGIPLLIAALAAAGAPAN